MLVELSEEQVKDLKLIIANATIKGTEAFAIVGLVNALTKKAENENKTSEQN